jgi:gas vesicle protein
MRNSDDSVKLIGALLAGAAIGGVLGILFAPNKGSITRSKIAGKPEEITDAIRDKFDDFLEEIKKEVETAKAKSYEFMKDGGSKSK